MYRESFFKYLFAHDIMDNPKGFEKIFHKYNEKKRFNAKLKRKTNKKKKKKNYKLRLTLSQISKIESLMNSDIKEDNIEMLKMSFCWYMLFHTDCLVDELKTEIDSKLYEDGIITSKNGSEYEVPTKYEPLFYHLRQREYRALKNKSSPSIRRMSTIKCDSLLPLNRRRDL